MTRQLIMSTEEFYKNLSSLIASGVIFASIENNGIITINFLGGY